MPLVRANGLSIHVNRYRAGPPGDRPLVVCVHGLAVVDSTSCSFLLGFHLAKDAEVITYDLRGHGHSDRVPSGYQISDHVDDLVALLDALEITQPIHLVGFSHGGAVAIVAAMRHPERMATLCLLDGQIPIAGWETNLLSTMERFYGWMDEARSQGLTRDQMEQMVAHHVMQTFGYAPRRAMAVSQRVVRLYKTTTLREDLKTEPVYDKSDFNRIDCPVLGIYGDQSNLYWMADVLPTLARDVTVHTIAGADHLGVFFSTDQVRPLVRQFLGLPPIDPPKPKGRESR